MISLHPMYGRCLSPYELQNRACPGVCCPDMNIEDGVCLECGREYYLNTLEQTENIIRRVFDHFEGQISRLEARIFDLENNQR